MHRPRLNHLSSAVSIQKTGKMRTVWLPYLLIKRSDAIPAVSHFAPLSLFNSYVIAHERTALRGLYTYKRTIVEGEPYHLPFYVSDFHENWATEIRAIRSEALFRKLLSQLLLNAIIRPSFCTHFINPSLVDENVGINSRRSRIQFAAACRFCETNRCRISMRVIFVSRGKQSSP